MHNSRKLVWLDNRTSPIYRKFVKNLFSQLGEYYDEFIRKTEEMPFYYGERPQIGHVAQSAGRCHYLSVQDYNVNVPGKLRRRLKNHYAPDLLIWVPVPGQEPHTCVFEAKVKYWTSIDTKEKRLAKIISSDLAEANKQIYQHGNKEGRFYCALSAVRIYCSSRKWEYWAKRPSLYNDKVDDLLNKIRCALGECRRSDDKPNFWWYYVARHNTIRRVYGEEKMNPTLGIFWVGLIKQH